jgi:hypothetical protein
VGGLRDAGETSATRNAPDPSTVATDADIYATPFIKLRTDERVFVRAQPDVTYGRFMAVMNDLRGHGFLQVGLLNEDID